MVIVGDCSCALPHALTGPQMLPAGWEPGTRELICELLNELVDNQLNNCTSIIHVKVRLVITPPCDNRVLRVSMGNGNG